MTPASGGRGAGKTTLVASVSDACPVKVEAGTDFGQVSLYPDLALDLYSTSEPSRSGFGGALGAVVLVDPRRIATHGTVAATFGYHGRGRAQYVGSGRLAGCRSAASPPPTAG
ncbi:MAG: hypothetical protein ACRDRV_02695 [Pseudonocardiaceae bacterium]